MSWILYSLLLNILVVITDADKLVTMDVSFKMTRVNKVYPLPVGNFKADGQNIYALVDTGATYLFFVWKYWFEDNLENCNELIFGCYECFPPCKQGPTKTFTFGDGSKVWLFPHSGKVDFNGGVSTPLDFGLVAGYNRDSATIWASLGLRPSNPATTPYKSIVEQLFAKKMITGNSFSIYFTTGDNPSGQLILGGDDPSKHNGPLSYVQIVDKDEHFIQVLELTIGSDPKNTITMVKLAALDTGASHIYINQKFKSQVIAFLQTAGTKKVQIQEKGVNFVMSCADAPNLPSMTFAMKGLKGEKVSLVISASSLVWKFQGDVCYIRIDFNDNDDEVVLGASAFLGHYYYFDLGNSKIGFANVR